jgi:hypothetical protein
VLPRFRPLTSCYHSTKPSLITHYDQFVYVLEACRLQPDTYRCVIFIVRFSVWQTSPSSNPLSLPDDKKQEIHLQAQSCTFGFSTLLGKYFVTWNDSSAGDSTARIDFSICSLWATWNQGIAYLCLMHIATTQNRACRIIDIIHLPGDTFFDIILALVHNPFMDHMGRYVGGIYSTSCQVSTWMGETRTLSRRTFSLSYRLSTSLGAFTLVIQ